MFSFLYWFNIHFVFNCVLNFDFYTWDPYNLSLVADQMLTKTNYFSQKVLWICLFKCGLKQGLKQSRRKILDWHLDLSTKTNSTNRYPSRQRTALLSHPCLEPRKMKGLTAVADFTVACWDYCNLLIPSRSSNDKAVIHWCNFYFIYIICKMIK